MGRKKIIPLLTLLLTLVLVAAAIGTAYFAWKADRADEDRRAELELAYQQESRALFSERTRLEGELETAKRTSPADDLNLGSLIILFTEPNAGIITDAAPLMRENGYTGIIAVSPTYFPGDRNCLTVAETQTLLNEGWQLALIATVGGDMEALQQRLREAGLPTATCAYITQTGDNTDWEKELEGLGLTALIMRALPAEPHSDLLLIEARGSNETGSSTKLAACVEQSTILALTVGFRSSYEMYTDNNFTNMLNVILKYQANEQLAVVDIPTAQSRYDLRQEQVDANAAALAQQITDLTAALEANQSEIDAVNQKYGDLLSVP